MQPKLHIMLSDLILNASKINTYTQILHYLQDFLKTIIVVIVIKRSYFDTQLLSVVDTNIKI